MCCLYIQMVIWEESKWKENAVFANVFDSQVDCISISVSLLPCSLWTQRSPSRTPSSPSRRRSAPRERRSRRRPLLVLQPPRRRRNKPPLPHWGSMIDWTTDWWGREGPVCDWPKSRLTSKHYHIKKEKIHKPARYLTITTNWMLRNSGKNETH